MMTKKAKDLLFSAPVEWDAKISKMPLEERGNLRRTFEALAEDAAMLARYLDARYDGGGGDQGHAKAVRAANKAASIVHCKAFGYNKHDAISF